MSQFPSVSSAYGVWNMLDVRDAQMGSNWPNQYGTYITYMGAISTAAATGGFWLAYNGGSLYALANSTVVAGTGTVYLSLDYGASWAAKGTMTGAGSSYGATCLATTPTTLIVAHRGYFFRSTNAGSTFTTILTTTGGQNNYYSISGDGTYGLCGGYSYDVYSNDNWVTCTSIAKPLGISMSTCTLTGNGGNRFIHAGFGSSGSPSNFYIANNTGATVYYTSSTLATNNNYAVSNPTTGVNAVVSNADTVSNTIYYATWSSTSYSTANVTGAGVSFTCPPCMSPQNRVVLATNTGVWRITLDGTTPPILLSSFTDVSSMVSDGSTYCYLVRTNGYVYQLYTS